MRKILTSVLTICFFINCYSQNADSLMAKKIFDEALTHGKSYAWLTDLCTNIGGRVSGSREAAEAVKWSQSVMDNLGIDRVYLQEMMVPHWVRGEKEQGKLIPSKGEPIRIATCALGGSIATPDEGITAELIEIKNFEELKKLGEKGIKGKIVFYNYPMNPAFISTGSAYGNAVGYRWGGASKAVKYGAVATIVRSMTLALDDYPHTGAMGYNDSLPKIPTAAVSTIGAELISDHLKSDPKAKFSLKMSCKTLPDVKSYNVIGEITGSEFPNEIIVVSGHLDAWDLGDGAHDDGAGCVQAIEVLRLFKVLGIKPKRTIRAVMYMNEENGGKGAEKYAELAKEKGEIHIAAMESDGGGFMPVGFGIKSDPEVLAKFAKWDKLFSYYGIHEIKKGWGGADVNKLKDQCKAIIGLRVSGQRYFDYHHNDSDTIDKVNKRELELGGAAMALLAYLISENGL